MRNVVLVTLLSLGAWVLLLGEKTSARHGPATTDTVAGSAQGLQAGGERRDDQSILRERLNFDKQKAASDANAERDRLIVEKDKVQVERDKLDFEKSKIWWTAVATVAPFVGVLLTLIYSVWSFRTQSAQQAKLWRLDAKQRNKQWRADAVQRDRQQAADAKLQFELKAAEIAFEGESPLAVQNRGKALKAIFGERLPDDFLSSYDPYKVGQKEGNPEYKKFLLELLLKHPDNQLNIVRFWKQLFPGDVGWLIKLDHLSSGQITKNAGEGHNASQPENKDSST